MELLTLLSLNTLNISRNCVGPQLTFDPAVSCPSLRYLNLSFNKIAAFPHELSRAASQLEELCLEGSVRGPSFLTRPTSANSRLECIFFSKHASLFRPVKAALFLFSVIVSGSFTFR